MLDCVFVCELAECHYLCVVKRNLRASFGFLNQLLLLAPVFESIGSGEEEKEENGISHAKTGAM